MSPGPSYSEILDLYRRGQIDAALSALALLSEEEIQSGQKLVMKALDESGAGDTDSGSVLLRTAALVHTDAAFRLPDSNAAGIQRHLVVARACIEKVAARGRDDAFVRDWWVLVISYFQGQFDLLKAGELGRRARDLVRDSPELFLAIGVTQEMAWTVTHDDDQEYGFTGDLRQAESDYRKALAIQPDFVEARLRLGRVLTLRGDSDGALQALAALQSAEDMGFRYLGYLFQGNALERRGNAAEAEKRYLAAFAALPEGQSARLALAHLRHAAGARAAAAEAVRATATDRGVREIVDPWFWYTRGLFWRADALMRTLRAQVQR
jgi:tetratricopeptide (TPR) repeat protein